MVMRTLFLLTVLISGYYLPAFSQSNSRLQSNGLQSDSMLRSFSYNNNFKDLHSDKSNGFKLPLDNSFSGKNFHYPKSGDKNLFFQKDTIVIFKQPQSVDRMSCLKPQGFFPMPIYKPDSTVKYTLLIKKYERVK